MQTHQSVPRDIHRPRMPAAHDGLSKVFAGKLGRQNAASQQKLWAIRQHPTEEIAGWTANSPTLLFKKPACLFPRDRVSKTNLYQLIYFSGNLRFR